jgi:GT2 family glycosyltransferase
MANDLPAPSVAVIVVNYEGGDLTLASVASLRAQRHPAGRLRVVLVDNASSDGVAARVRAQWSDVVVVDAGANLGFAGGVNLGVRHAGDAEYVGLLNPDATAEPGWLPALLAALEADPGVGAANAKVLFDVRFRDVTFDRPTRVDGARQEGTDVSDRLQYVTGWLGPAYERAHAYQWSAGPALLRVPDGAPVELRIDGRWIPAPAAGPPQDVINSAGLLLTPDGFGADRGYLEVDRGQYDERAEVFAWTGSSVLMRRAYLDAVGPLDERLFLYYEDLEHSWRGREAGWRFVCEPAAVTRHVHQAAAGRSPRTDVLIERNRLIVLRRHTSLRRAAGAAARHLLITGSYARRDVVSRVLHGRRPSFVIVGRRLRALGGALVARRWRPARPAPSPGPRRPQRLDR